MKEFGGLLQIFLDHFQRHGEPSLPFLIEGRVSSWAFMVEYKKLPPIETMPQKEKREMWLFVKDLFPDKPPEFKLRASKILYTIGTLL